MSNHTFSLTHLIEMLQSMLHSLSAKIHHRHIENSKMGEAKGEVDIWGKVGHFLESTPQIHEEDLFHLQDEDMHQAHNNTDMHRPSHEQGAELSELGKYYQRRVRTESPHPHVSDQMQRNTFDHINTALHMARKGDKAAARLHIELAESAVHTAGRFMSHEQYAAFEQKIEHRLQHLVQHGHQVPKHPE